MLGKLNLLKASWSLSSLTAKVGVIALATTFGLANVVGSAGASLNATAFNTARQNITSGDLSLTLSAGSGVGFTSAILLMKPMDTQSRFVTYTNEGDFAFATPTLAVAAFSAGSGGVAISVGSADAILTTGSLALTSGLRVWVQNCATAWTVVSTGSTSSSCSGGATDVISTGSGTVTVLDRAVPIATLVAGAVTMTNLTATAGAVNNLRYMLYIPDKTETTVNGKTNASYANPALDPTSIQGKSAWLTWTVTVNQPATINGNS